MTTDLDRIRSGRSSKTSSPRSQPAPTSSSSMGRRLDNINSRLQAVAIGKVGGNVKFSYVVL